MRKEIFSSSLWLLIGNSAQQGMQLVAFILLARFLSPSTFGYVAMASVVIEVAATIAMWGMVNIAQQRRHVLTPRLVSHIFVLSLIIATVLSLIIAGGVTIYSLFYGFGLTCQLIIMLIPILYFQAVRIAPEGILFRNMLFKWVAVRNNAAALVGGGIAVLLAYLGFEVYALVVQKLVALMMLSAIVWLACGDQIHLLKWNQYNFRLFKAIAKAGGQIVSVPIASTVSGRTLDALIGGFLGAAALGAFKITWRIFELVQQFTLEPLKQVSSSAFPKLFGSGSELHNIYNQVLLVSALFVIPAYAGLGFTAPEWVPLIIGPQWMGTIPLFYIFAFSSIAVVFAGLQITLLIAHRENRLIMIQNIISTAALAGVVFLGVQFGLEATICLYILFCYAVVFYNQWAIKRITGWPFLESFRVVVPSIIATFVMLLALEGTKKFALAENDVLALIELITVGVIVYAAGILLTLRRTIIPIIIKILKRKNLSAEPAPAHLAITDTKSLEDMDR